MEQWKPMKADLQEVRRGMDKIRDGLVQNAKEAAARGSRLPKDWRNRIFRR